MKIYGWENYKFKTICQRTLVCQVYNLPLRSPPCMQTLNLSGPHFFFKNALNMLITIGGKNATLHMRIKIWHVTTQEMALFELLPKLRMNCRTVTWNTRFREHLKTSHSGNVIRFEGIIVNTLLFGSSRPTLYTFLDFYLFPGFWLPCTNWQETGWYKENENGFLLPWIPHLSCPVPYSTGTWVSRPFSFFRP